MFSHYPLCSLLQKTFKRQDCVLLGKWGLLQHLTVTWGSICREQTSWLLIWEGASEKSWGWLSLRVVSWWDPHTVVSIRVQETGFVCVSREHKTLQAQFTQVKFTRDFWETRMHFFFFLTFREGHACPETQIFVSVLRVILSLKDRESKPSQHFAWWILNQRKGYWVLGGRLP